MGENKAMKIRKTLAGAGLILATLTMAQAMNAQTLDHITARSQAVAADRADLANRALRGPLQQQLHRESGAYHGFVVGARNVYLYPTVAGVEVVEAAPDGVVPPMPGAVGPWNAGVQYAVQLDGSDGMVEAPVVVSYVQDQGPVMAQGAYVVVNAQPLPGDGFRIFGMPNPDPQAYYDDCSPGGYAESQAAVQEYVTYVDTLPGPYFAPRIGLFESPRAREHRAFFAPQPRREAVRQAPDRRDVQATPRDVRPAVAVERGRTPAHRETAAPVPAAATQHIEKRPLAQGEKPSPTPAHGRAGEHRPEL